MHDKVAVADDTVITGSFNFSNNAMKNAENILVIKNKALADQYAEYIQGLLQIRKKKLHYSWAKPNQRNKGRERGLSMSISNEEIRGRLEILRTWQSELTVSSPVVMRKCSPYLHTEAQGSLLFSIRLR